MSRSDDKQADIIDAFITTRTFRYLAGTFTIQEKTAFSVR